MCWIDKIDNIDRISAREKVSIVVFITRQNGGKASFGRAVCNSWPNILANSANYKAFRGKVIMSSSDMIIIESCGCIGNTTWSVWIEKYHRKPHVCIHLLKQNGDLWTTIWNKWCKEGKIFNTKWKCCCQGEGILVLHLKLYFTPPTTLFSKRCKIMLGGGGGVKKNVVARGRGSFWGVLPTSPPNQNWNSPNEQNELLAS